MNKNPEWDAGAFAKEVHAKIGPCAAENFFRSVKSIEEKFNYANFHSMKALELMRPHKKDEEDRMRQVAENIRILFHSDEAEQKKMIGDLYDARIYTVSFALCLHSTADYMAKAIYFGIDLENRFSVSIPHNRIGLHSVLKKITGISQLNDLEVAIRHFLASNSFKYLSAFTNTDKHHEIIPANFSLSFEVGSVPSSGIRIDAFEYEGFDGIESYQKKWASEFFHDDMIEIQGSIAKIGLAMDRVIRAY